MATLLFFLLLAGSNLGNVVDSSQKAVPSDIIVALGGGSGDRIIKALELYKAGYAKTGAFIYTGRDTVASRNVLGASFGKRAYLEEKGIVGGRIIHVDRPATTNTMEEVLFIKELMLKNKLKSVLFVSDPWHTGRISAFAKIIARYEEAGLSYRVVGTCPSWWDKKAYYKHVSGVKVTFKETGKLAYNLLKYGTPLIRFTKYCKKKRSGQWEKALTRIHLEKKKKIPVPENVK